MLFRSPWNSGRISKLVGQGCTQVIITKIWEENQDNPRCHRLGLGIGQEQPVKKSLFRYIVGTEYIVIPCTEIVAEENISIYLRIAYHRPFDPREKRNLRKVRSRGGINRDNSTNHDNRTCASKSVPARDGERRQQQQRQRQ